MKHTSQVPIATVQEYWDNRPCNIRHSKKELGSKDYFDEVEKRKYFVEPHIPKFAQFEMWSGKRVLEVGCGIGTDAINFVRAGANYTGIDVSQKSLDLTQRRLEVFGLNGRLLHANVEELSSHLSGETFDLIYSFGVLHHTPSSSSALKQLIALSHAGTELRIMVYASRSWKAALIDAGLEQPEAQAGCPIANTYSREEISALLESEGFSVIDVNQDHIFPYQVEPYKNHEYILEQHFAAMAPGFFASLEKVLGWHLLVKAIPAAPSYSRAK